MDIVKYKIKSFPISLSLEKKFYLFYLYRPVVAAKYCRLFPGIGGITFFSDILTFFLKLNFKKLFIYFFHVKGKNYNLSITFVKKSSKAILEKYFPVQILNIGLLKEYSCVVQLIFQKILL